MGIAANLQQESGFRHDAEGDGGNAYGLAQWHKERQADFARFSGKDIKKSTAEEQLEFINYELTKGKERSAGDQLKMTTNAYDAASVVSTQYERPADRSGEAMRRGELAQSYAPTPGPKLAPVDLPAPVETKQPPQEKPQEGFLDHTKTWLDSYRQPPRDHSVDTVVQAPTKPVETTSKSSSPALAPSYIDNRQFHIHGADVEKVKQLYNEQISTLTEQTSQDFRSPEQ